MGTIRRSIAISAVAVAVTLGTAGAASASPTVQNGDCFDVATNDCGGWDRTGPPGNRLGANGRPFLKYLSVTNAGTETVVVDNRVAQVPTPTVIGSSNIYALVTPTNACKVGQNPAPNVCYEFPNRVTVSLSRPPAGGGGLTWSDNFSAGPATTPSVTADSIVHMIVGFKSGYTALRWSWVSGEPTYWRSTVNPFGGEVELKFRPRTQPHMLAPPYCSGIPVSTCDIQRADEERLMPTVILSMDETLSAALSGALFGSSGAFIGSLEASPLDTPGGPTLTYGIAAPHLNADGSDRRGTFYALLQGSILGLFNTSTESFNQDILAVERTNGTGSFNLGWAPWSAAAQGTTGQFLTISDISFSAPKFAVKRRGSGAGDPTNSPSTGNPGAGPRKTARKRPTLKAKRTVGLAALARGFEIRTPRGAKLSVKVSTPKVCKATSAGIQGIKAGTCRATLTIKPRKGKSTKRSISFAVVK